LGGLKGKGEISKKTQKLSLQKTVALAFKSGKKVENPAVQKRKSQKRITAVPQVFE